MLLPQPEGGFTVTSPVVSELVTEGDTLEEATTNAKDALAAVIESYQDVGRLFPVNARIDDETSPIWLETVVATP